MKFPKPSKFQTLAFILIVSLGLTLRLINLDSLPVFADEAIYVRWAQVMRAEPTLRFLPLNDGKQPLYMWMVIPFQKVITDPVIAGRVVSALSGMATIVGVGVLGFILFNSINVALIAASFYALSPFAVFYERLALVDSMLSMFGIWFLIFSLFTVIHKRLDLAMISGFVLGGAWLTKSPALFFVLLLPSTLLFYKLPSKGKDPRKDITKVILRFLVTVFVGYGMYNILRLGPNFHMISLRNRDYVYPLKWILESPLDPFIPFFHRNIQYFLILGNFMLVLLLVIGLANLRRYWKQIILLLAWLLVPIMIVSEYSQTMTARYVFYTVPYFTILAASSYLVFVGKLKSVFGLLLLGFLITAVYQNYQNIYNIQKANLPRSERSGFLEEWTAGTGIKESSEIIRSQYLSDPNTKIVVGTEGLFGTLPDAMQAYLNDLPEITVIGVGLDLTEVPTSLVESRQSGNETYYVINKSRLRIDPDEEGLEIIKVFEKAQRSEDGFEYHLYGGGRDSLLLMRLR